MNEGTKRIVAIVMALLMLGVAGYRFRGHFLKKKPVAASSGPSQSESGGGQAMQPEPGMQGPPGDPMGEMPGGPMGENPGGPMGEMPGGPMGENPGGPMGEMPGGPMGEMGQDGTAIPAAWQGIWVMDVDASLKQGKQMLAKMGRTMTPQMEQQARQLAAANPNRIERRQLAGNTVVRLRSDNAGQVREHWSLQVLEVSEQEVRAKVLGCRTEILSGQDAPARRAADAMLPGKEIQIKCRNGFLWITVGGDVLPAPGVFRKQHSPEGQ